jgi:hypothetical protein
VRSDSSLNNKKFRENKNINYNFPVAAPSRLNEGGRTNWDICHLWGRLNIFMMFSGKTCRDQTTWET